MERKEFSQESFERSQTPTGERQTHTVTSATEPSAGAPQEVYEKKRVVFRLYQIIWYILGIVEVLLAFRFVLKLLGASTASGFVTFMYNVSRPLAAPFYGIFGVNVAGVSVFEWTTLVAMVVYALIAWGLVKLFSLIKPASPEEVERVTSNQ